jgi:sugar phosphate isomerase/epimerase
MWRTPVPDRFVVGVNLPWVGYGTDVGTSAWFPGGGLSQQPAALERLDRTFETLARDGMKVARTFLLCDARSGVLFDAGGMPSGLDATVLPDIAALVTAARRHGIGLVPVLLDFHLCGPREIVNGVQLGGRSHLIADRDAAAALVDRVIRPIVEMFADEEAIVAWDVMNEPEWCLPRGLFAGPTTVSFAAMRRFLSDAVQLVHRHARQPVTVGSAGTWALDLVTGIDLDFYQIHWYDRFGWDALARPVAELGLADRPVILGEFSGRSTRIAEVLDAAKAAGYEGALVWSVLSQDEHSAYPADVVEWVRARATP